MTQDGRGDRRAELASSLQRVHDRIAAACAAGARDPAEVTLTVVTKFFPASDVRLLAGLGVADVGENRHQEAQAKAAECADLGLRWHFIGHLQSRKAKTVNEICELCHSLSSESAAAKLTIPALVEVNLSGEESKSGVTPDQLPALVAAYPHVRGLMTMPPFTEDPDRSRPYFRRLRDLAEQHGLRELSMGTSQDWRVAVEEGATYIRVGAGIFRPAE